jgi:hypothetical protein
MALELFVTQSDPGDRTQPWIDVLLWSIGDDPKLIEAVRFTGGAELRVWVKAIRAEHGDPHITVRWTPALKGNRALSHLVAACVGTTVPT